MFIPSASGQAATLWEHCRRALDYGWRLGPHGLPLMGNGDWNDGMNLVGAEGKGESVWLAWFLCATLEAFAETMESHDTGRALASEWRQRAATLKHRTEEVAWDGDWYLRAFFDDGSPLGSHANREARIDSLPQSWSVISRAGDAERSRRAMESAEINLVNVEEKLVMLFTPPFDNSKPSPGYIMGYPPGLRENGGQYTHGSLWLAMAWSRLNEGTRAVHLLQLMNPVEHSRSPEAAEHYRGEPYVVAADVYTAPGRVGQSGWTWYTGSAGWMYRIWIEEVLGFRLRGNQLTIDPVLPDDWPGFELTYKYKSTVYEIKVTRSANGARVPLVIDLEDDGWRHQLTSAEVHEDAPVLAGN